MKWQANKYAWIDKFRRWNICNSILIIIFLVALSQITFASTTDEFGLGETVTKIRHLIGGTGGKLIGFSSLLLGVIGSAVRFNPYIFLGCLATCLVCLVGPGMIDKIFTAGI